VTDSEREIFYRDVRFRVNELSDWVKDFVRMGDAGQARFWASEACRISRQLPEAPQREPQV